MADERNGYARWWQVVAAMVAAGVAVLSFILAREANVVHVDQYRVDQSRIERQLDRIEQKIDGMQGDKH